MCKEAGQSNLPASREVRKAWGLKIWELGEIFRPGKTKRERESGQHANYLQNREARRDENKRQAGTYK
jgi:hypothetical protein